MPSGKGVRVHVWGPKPAVAGLLLAVGSVTGLSGSAAEVPAEEDTCKGRPISIEGTAEDDELVGTPGDDVIRAYTGDDVIEGRGGDDMICADAGADTLVGGDGDDALHGGPYRLYSADGESAAEGDVLSGGRGDDRIFGGGTSVNETATVSPAHVTPDRVEFPEARGGITVTQDGVVTGRGIGRDRVSDVQHIVGTDWVDRITVDGQEVVSGGDGADRISVVAGGRDPMLYPTLFGDGGSDRLDLSRSDTAGYWLYGGEGGDTLIGSRYDDYIGDGAGAGAVAGRGGDDQIDVTSRMSVAGGSGDDSMHVALDTGRRGAVDGGPDDDRVELANSTSAPLAIDVPDQSLSLGEIVSTLTGVEDFRTSARQAAVRFLGGAGDEQFGVVTWRGHTVRARMGGGDDYFEGYAAVDSDDYGAATVWGGAGDDVFDGAESDDNMSGESGDDTMFGDSGNDLLRGGAGDDRAYASRGEADVCVGEVEESCER